MLKILSPRKKRSSHFIHLSAGPERKTYIGYLPIVISRPSTTTFTAELPKIPTCRNVNRPYVIRPTLSISCFSTSATFAVIFKNMRVQVPECRGLANNLTTARHTAILVANSEFQKKIRSCLINFVLNDISFQKSIYIVIIEFCIAQHLFFPFHQKQNGCLVGG